MWLVIAEMRRPVTVAVAVLAMVLAAALAIRRMPVDIFPQFGDPAIYVAQPYGGMDPAQMEGFSPTITSITSSTSPESSTSKRRTYKAPR